ncbi:MAG: opacity family porin [Polyangiales bacterium]
MTVAADARAQARDAAAEPPDEHREEPPEPTKERRNAVELGYTHAFQILRTSPSEAEAGSSENLWGFTLSYERLLIPHRLALVIAKPFHFTRDRFDSPLDVFLRVVFPKGRWDPYVGAGASGNLRVFSGELEQEEGRRVEYTFGVGTIAGVTYAFTPRWGLSLEVGYAYFVNGLAQHSITDGISGVFSF